MRALLLAVAALAVTGGPVMAEPQAPKPQSVKTEGAWLTLAAPAPRQRVVFDGAVWLCQDTICHATWVKGLPALRSCKRLAREIGPITAFGYRGAVLTDAQLADCGDGLARSQIAAAR